jgi:hypothetical protein
MQNNNELFLDMISGIEPEKQSDFIKVFLKLCQGKENSISEIWIYQGKINDLTSTLGISKELVNEFLDILESRTFIKKEAESESGNKAFTLNQSFRIEIKNNDEFSQKVAELQNRLKDRKPSRISGAPEGTFSW